VEERWRVFEEEEEFLLGCRKIKKQGDEVGYWEEAVGKCSI
jgi:hypothetical protein